MFWIFQNILKNLKRFRIQNVLNFKIFLKISKQEWEMNTAYASEQEQNTLSSVCPVLATVVPNKYLLEPLSNQ